MTGTSRTANDGPARRISGREILVAWGLIGLIAFGTVAADFAFPPGEGPATTSLAEAAPAAQALVGIARDGFENPRDRAAALAGTETTTAIAAAGPDSAPRVRTAHWLRQHLRLCRREIGAEASARNHGNS